MANKLLVTSLEGRDKYGNDIPQARVAAWPRQPNGNPMGENNRAAARATASGVAGILPADCRTALGLLDPALPVAEIFQRRPSLKRLYLAEQETGQFARLRGAPTAAAWLPDPRVRIIPYPPPVSLADFFAPDFMFFVEGKIGLLLTDRETAARPELCQRLQTELLNTTRRTLSSVALRATRGWHVMANLLLNLPRAAGERRVDELRGLAAGRPVVVVGAGPSLDRNIRALIPRRQDVVIVACDAACTTLEQNRITPDLAVTTDDSEKIWLYFAPMRELYAKVPLVCLAQSSWPLFRYYAGPLLVGRRDTPSNAAIARLIGGLPILDSGQCVGHAAFETARLLGGNPIILIGFDLGYSGDRFHPRHLAVPYFHLPPPAPENLTQVPGFDGRPVTTDISMVLYLREFERRIAAAGIPVWDATEGGALKAGARVLPLKSALEEVRGRSKRGALSLPPRAAAPGAPPPLARIREDAARLIGDICEARQEPAQALAASGSVALPFLQSHRELLELIADTENPAEVAEFLFAWEDWVRAGAPRDDLVTGLAIRHLGEIESYVRLVPLLAEMASRPERTAASARRLMVFTGGTHPELAWDDFLSFLKISGYSLATYAGEPNDISGIWSRLTTEAVDGVIMYNGALLPAGWAIPGMAALDFITHPPDANVIPEQWLPGYSAVCPAADLAASWRERIPEQRPVCIFTPPIKLARYEVPDALIPPHELLQFS